MPAGFDSFSRLDLCTDSRFHKLLSADPAEHCAYGEVHGPTGDVGSLHSDVGPAIIYVFPRLILLSMSRID